uniref:Uncharacterized protein n=2 Tax=Caenorhabditis japonica TaxID=281687 RepID=A0A8R1IVV9_CAEJA
MWRVEKDIFDFGEKLGELVERKMDSEDASFTYMVDYIFNLRAWFREHREAKDIKVYIGPSSTYMSHAYVRNFTPVFLKEEDGIPYIYIFKETVFTNGLIEDQLAKISLKEDVSSASGPEQEDKEKRKKKKLNR